MDSIEIIYYDLKAEIYKPPKSDSLINLINSNPGGSWTVGENGLFRKGGKFVDFRLNGKSLKERIEENLNCKYFDNQIFNLGSTIFFDNLDFAPTKIQIFRLLGKTIREKEIQEVYEFYNNKNHSLEYIQWMAQQEDDNLVFLTVCRACGDYDCGVDPIKIKKEKNKFIWDFSSFYNGIEIENENLQYEYEFDAIEYITELYSFEKYFKQLIIEKKQKSYG